MNQKKITEALMYVGVIAIVLFFANEFLGSTAGGPISQIAQIVGGVQVLTMDVKSDGYSPNQFTVQAGKPVRWDINGINTFGCQGSIQIPKLNKLIAVKPGKNDPVEFTPTKAEEIDFACTMGMFRGKITVKS